MIIDFEAMNYTAYSNVANNDFERMLATWQKLAKLPSTLERRVEDNMINIYLKTPCHDDQLIISYDNSNQEMITY